jgi:hypothetical protein
LLSKAQSLHGARLQKNWTQYFLLHIYKSFTLCGLFHVQLTTSAVKLLLILCSKIRSQKCQLHYQLYSSVLLVFYYVCNLMLLF